jgi:hypothetical protein
MPSRLPAALASFTHPHDAEQLRSLEQTVSSLTPASLTEEDFRAVFDLFERFPEEDEYGIFWSLLHAVEAVGGYELALLESVQRTPAGFNVAMLCRFLNGGVKEIAGRNLVSLVTAVVARRDISTRARETAEEALSAHGTR